VSATDLAQRYGQALLTLAGEQNVQRRAVDELDALRALIARSPPLKACLDNPAIPVPAKQAILDELMAPACCALARNFVALLVGSRRDALLAEIVQFLQAKLDEQAGRVKVQLQSALAMTAADRAAVADRIARWLHKEVELEITVAPELLAGIMIRIGDRLVDGSCRGQLARIRQVMMA